MEWKEFVWVVKGLVKEFWEVGNWDEVGRWEVKKRLRRVFGDGYLRVYWSDGKGRVMLGMCGIDWDYNWEEVRLERFEERVRKEVGWF